MGKNQYTTTYFFSSTHKQCRDCKEIKEYKDFHRDKRSSGGISYYCKECATTRSRLWHLNNKQNKDYLIRRRDTYYRMTYSLSLEDRNNLLLKQNNKCKICLIPLEDTPNTHIDHCHKSNTVRGILCTNCNRGLGHFQDSISILESAIMYLKNHTDNVGSEGRAVVDE